MTDVAGANRPDWIGINFSPVSRRRADADTLAAFGRQPSAAAVAVFYRNSEAEIRNILAQYPFKTVQLYAGDVSADFVRTLRCRVILAVRMEAGVAWSDQVAPYAADVDFFILDGATPGSGQRMEAEVSLNFPYPFLLAGGLNLENLSLAAAHPNCIGVDMASGIETAAAVDQEKIRLIAARLADLRTPKVS